MIFKYREGRLLKMQLYMWVRGNANMKLSFCFALFETNGLFLMSLVSDCWGFWTSRRNGFSTREGEKFGAKKPITGKAYSLIRKDVLGSKWWEGEKCRRGGEFFPPGKNIFFGWFEFQFCFCDFQPPTNFRRRTNIFLESPISTGCAQL